jgi:hypothetical protein
MSGVGVKVRVGVGDNVRVGVGDAVAMIVWVIVIVGIDVAIANGIVGIGCPFVRDAHPVRRKTKIKKREDLNGFILYRSILLEL